MNTDTNTRPAHVRGLAAAIIRDARAERGLVQGHDLPTSYRVGREVVGGRELSGYGVAYPPKFAAAHMPFGTTTRLLKRGFVILTEAEAAEIALAYVTSRGPEALRERHADMVKRCQQWAAERPEEADTYAEHVRRDHERLVAELAKLEKAATRYAKLVAKAAPVDTVEAIQGRVSAAAAQQVAAARASAEPSLEEGRKAAQLQARKRAGWRMAETAAALTMARAAWEASIREAAELGMSHREIAKAAGCTHPTVAKVLAAVPAR